MAKPPPLSDDQRQAAFAKAAAVRAARAEIKERLKMGTVTLADLIARADDDDVIGKMKVLSVLESLPRVGKVRARRTMGEIGIAENRRLRGLGANQRKALLERFS